MNLVSLEDLEAIRTGSKHSDEQYNRDRHMYQQGRVGYPSSPSESLSERDRGCYMMGFQATMWENGHV